MQRKRKREPASSIELSWGKRCRVRRFRVDADKD